MKPGESRGGKRTGHPPLFLSRLPGTVALDAPDAASWLGLARLERDGSALVENFVRTVREAAEIEGLSDYLKPGSTPQEEPRR